MLKRLPRSIRWIVTVMSMLLVLMSVYRLFFFFHYRDENNSFSGSTFLLGLRYDARSVSILGIIMLLFGTIPYLSPFKKQQAYKWWTFFISLLVFVLLIFYVTDFFYYDYLKQRLNASVLNFLADAHISGGMVWQTYPIVTILLLLIGLIYLFAKWHMNLLKRLYVSSRIESKLNYFIFILLLTGFTFGKLDQYPLRWSDAFLLSNEFKANAALNPFQSFFSSLRFKNSSYDIKKVKSNYPVIAAYLGVQNPDSNQLNFDRKYQFENTSIKPNIVVVICESFSAYKSSMFGNKLNPTPYFNEMCNKGVFFERCFTPAFGTARGVWATITGIPDVEQSKTSSRNPAAVDQHSIMNDFTDYNKFYFLGGSTTWANIRGLLKNNIADLNIYEQDNFNSSRVDVWGISDKNLFLESNKILATQQKPFFAIIQTADNHRPYTIPEEDLNEFTKLNYEEDTLKKYGFESNGQLNAFRYTDFNFNKFIEAAKKEKYFDNTIFVFVGDHGLRGNAGNMFPLSFSKEGILAEHVPLLFYAPKILPTKRVHDVSSQLDIMPSVAFLAKQNHTNTSLGRNLFDSLDKKNHYAFIADPDMLTVGMVSNDYYYYKNIKTNKTDFVSVKDNDAVIVNNQTETIKKYMASLNDAWYETAKYLLLNNKKAISQELNY